MKLLQLNAWAGRLEKQIAGLVDDEQPDIICLQEAISAKGDAGFFKTVEEIAKILKTKHIFHSPTFSFHLMSQTAHFGNCIISKLPFDETSATFTGREYVADFDFETHSANMRNLQHVKITLKDGSLLNVLNHHGFHIPEHKNGNDETMRQMKLIADYAAALEGKVILTGDFNLSPKAASLELVNKVLKNLSVEAGIKTTRTTLTHKTEVCDYIFVSPEVKVESFRVSEEVVSDHMALIMRFR